MIIKRKIVGYIRSSKGDSVERDVQVLLMKQYSESRGLEVSQMFIDMGRVKYRRRKDVEDAKRLGIPDPKRSICFPAWNEMLLMAMRDEIEAIVVDRMERLYMNRAEKNVLDAVVRTHGISIIETSILECSKELEKCNAAFYHYYIPNNQTEGIRTANLLKDIRTFYGMITENSDWQLCGLYIDRSANKRTELQKLLKRDDIDVIVCKYFYLINRKTLAFLQAVRKMNSRGISLISTEEGVIRYVPKGWKLPAEKLTVATYDCCRSEYELVNQAITRNKLKLYCRTAGLDLKTMGCYEEETRKPAAEFEQLVQNKAKYDLVITDSFAKFGDSVNELMGCVRRLGIPIISMKEGLLYIDGKPGTV